MFDLRYPAQREAFLRHLAAQEEKKAKEAQRRKIQEWHDKKLVSSQGSSSSRRVSRKTYNAPSIIVKRDYLTYYRDERQKQLRRERLTKGVVNSSFSIVILALVLLILGRFLFGSYNAETFDPSTVLPTILEGFSNSSWSTEYLMFTLRNFSAIDGWTISSSGILQALKTIVAIIGYAGNFLMLLSALLLNAVQVVFLIFKLLFVPL